MAQTDLSSGAIAESDFNRPALLTSSFYNAFNQAPVIAHLGFDAPFVAFGDTSALHARVVDFDVSNATSDSEDIAYAFGIDHVDGSGDVLHYGGGAHCSLSWLTVGGGYATSGSFQSLGAVGRTLAATFAPTGSGVARFCRITLNATDWQGVSHSIHTSNIYFKIKMI